MNILLTGGAGYIGSHVVLSLLDKGHNVTVIDNLITGHKEILPKDLVFYNCNINNKEKIAEIIRSSKFDLLMHFAGFIKVEESVSNPEKYFENNTANAISLFETCIENNLNNIIFLPYFLENEDKIFNLFNYANPRRIHDETAIYIRPDRGSDSQYHWLLPSSVATSFIRRRFIPL